MLNSEDEEQIIRDLPNEIYKYYSYNDNFKDSLQNSYLYYSKTEYFNDPFDFNPELLCLKKLEPIIDYIKAQKNLTRKQHRILSQGGNNTKRIIREAFNLEVKKKWNLLFFNNPKKSFNVGALWGQSQRSYAMF